MAMVQVGMGLSRVVVLVSAGLTGSVVLRNGSRVSDFLGEIQEILLDKGAGGDENGAGNVSKSLLLQVNQLTMEVRLLSSNNVTVLHVGSVLSALVAPAAVAGALGYGYMWWKGISFSSLMYVTKQNMANAVASMTKHLEQVQSSLVNGRRHVSSSKNEVSRDLVVNVKSKKQQALPDVLPILTKLRHALDMQMELETFIERENYFQAFQLLPEYLQILENYSGLSAVQEMGRGVEAWLARTILKLDTHLLGVCRTFNEESYLAVIDAYALMGNIGGMAEKMQSFFLQEVLSQTHFVLNDMLDEFQLAYRAICGKYQNREWSRIYCLQGLRPFL